MGKRLEDLNLDDHDKADHPRLRTHGPDDRDAPWYRFCEEIDELIASGDYDWAHETLSGIRTSVEQYRTVTPGQERAIANIRAARGRADGFRRRYEGFERRGGW